MTDNPKELVARLRKLPQKLFDYDKPSLAAEAADWIEQAAEREADLMDHVDVAEIEGAHLEDDFLAMRARAEAAERANVRLREAGSLAVTRLTQWGFNDLALALSTALATPDKEKPRCVDR